MFDVVGRGGWCGGPPSLLSRWGVKKELCCVVVERAQKEVLYSHLFLVDLGRGLKTDTPGLFGLHEDGFRSFRNFVG